jgi:hypothetical protein
MHSATFPSVHCRRHAKFAGARFGAASSARQHRARVTGMIARHLSRRAVEESAHVPVRQWSSLQVSAHQ